MPAMIHGPTFGRVHMRVSHIILGYGPRGEAKAVSRDEWRARPTCSERQAEADLSQYGQSWWNGSWTQLAMDEFWLLAHLWWDKDRTMHTATPQTSRIVPRKSTRNKLRSLEYFSSDQCSMLVSVENY